MSDGRSSRLPSPGALRLRIAPVLTAVALTVLLLWLVGSTADVFLLLFLAVLLSLYLGAVTDLFQQRLRLPETLAFTAAILVSLGMVLGLFWLIVPRVIEQTQQLIQVLPNYIEGWEAAIDRQVAREPALAAVWKPGQHRLLYAAYDQVASSMGGVVPRVVSIVEGAISIISVSVMAIYLALHPGLYREWLIALFPPVHRDLVRDVLGDLADTLRRYIVGQLTTMALLGALTAIGLWALRVPYWLTFGVFTGAVAVIPFFGTLLSTTLPALFVLGGPDGGTRALLVIGLGVVIHLIEGNLISPKIMSRALELPPVLTIVAVLIIGRLLGGVGLIVAVPLLATIMVVIRRILINRIYEGQGFRRTVRDRVLMLRVPVPDGGVALPNEPPMDVLALAEREEGVAV